MGVLNIQGSNACVKYFAKIIICTMVNIRPQRSIPEGLKDPWLLVILERSMNNNQTYFNPWLIPGNNA